MLNTTEAAQVNEEPSFRETPLAPFGVRISPRRGTLAVDDVPHEYLAALVAQHQVVVLQGVTQSTVTPKSFEEYARGFGELLEWPFGYVLDVRLVEDTKNYIFTRDKVEFHCDGVFARAEPHYLFFHCVKAPLEGGETLLSDTHRVWQQASEADRDWLRALRCRYVQELTAHYGGTRELSVVGRHPRTDVPILRYAEPVSGRGGNRPDVITASGIDEEATVRLAEYMSEVLYWPEVCFEHKWVDGDLMLFDNHRLLHGRRAFGFDSARHLRRVHVL